MVDPVTLTLDQLPLEVLHRVFCYLDVLDLVRIRSVGDTSCIQFRLSPTILQVSRYLNDASYCRSVWSDVYRSANFVRPPGPFPSQSAHDLEHTLIASCRIDLNFRRRHGSSAAEWERPRPTRRIRYNGMDVGVILVFGRFLLVAFKDYIQCCTLNLRKLHARSIHRSSGGALSHFDCLSAVDGEGRQFACVIFNEEMEATKKL